LQSHSKKDNLHEAYDPCEASIPSNIYATRPLRALSLTTALYSSTTPLNRCKQASFYDYTHIILHLTSHSLFSPTQSI